MAGMLGSFAVAEAGQLYDSMSPSSPKVRMSNDSIVSTLDEATGSQKTTLGTLLNIEIPATPVRYISVGTTEDKHAVCTGPCRVESILAGNVAATVAFLKCENDTSANTAPGTDTPEFSMPIPGAATGGGFMAPFPVGKYFSNALTCWIVTGKADSDVAEVVANDVHLNYDVKLCAVGAVYPQC